MATMEAKPEAKPEPKEIEENFATVVAWEAGKPSVRERVTVAPPEAMEMRRCCLRRASLSENGGGRVSKSFSPS
ncbi:hypothetical protein ACFX15_044091 [Malus domestica]